MKKAVAVFLSALMLLCAFAPCCAAAEDEREYFEDGSYIVVSYENPHFDIPDDGFEDDNVSNESEANPESAESKLSRFLKPIIEFIKKIIELFTNQKTVSKKKYVSYYDSQGTLLWTVYIIADFIYNGKNSVCNNVNAGYAVYDFDWKIISRECSKNGNTATAHFTVKQYKLAVPLKTIEKTVTLTCDKDGNIR